jgi:cyclic pyranopterin phosphate synthase
MAAKNRWLGLIACGVKRINVSVDTLDADKFRTITRWGDLDLRAGIDAAQAAGRRSRSMRSRFVASQHEIPTLVSGRIRAAWTSR